MKSKTRKISTEISTYISTKLRDVNFSSICSEYVCTDEWEKASMVYLILFVYYINEEKS